MRVLIGFSRCPITVTLLRHRGIEAWTCDLRDAEHPSHNHMALHEPQACHNPACINPKHLRWGLPKENTADRLIDGTAAIRERNPAAKLTTDDVSRIREDNRVHRLIARDYGVSRSQISRIKKGVAW